MPSPRRHPTTTRIAKKCGKWKKVRDREFSARQLSNRFFAFITLPNRYVALFTPTGTRWLPDRNAQAGGKTCATELELTHCCSDHRVRVVKELSQQSTDNPKPIRQDVLQQAREGVRRGPQGPQDPYVVSERPISQTRTTRLTRNHRHHPDLPQGAGPREGLPGAH